MERALRLHPVRRSALAGFRPSGWDTPAMDEVLATRSARFALLLDVWSGGDPGALATLITEDYVGHMLHLAEGDRTAEQYAARIRAYREASPGARFAVVDQTAGQDRLWSRLLATNGDGRQAHGMNVSRFAGDRICEEWAVWSGWHE
jgi:SnoaL-like domain